MLLLSKQGTRIGLPRSYGRAGVYLFWGLNPAKPARSLGFYKGVQQSRVEIR